MNHIIMPGISYFLATYRAEQLIVCLNPPASKKAVSISITFPS